MLESGFYVVATGFVKGELVASHTASESVLHLRILRLCRDLVQ